MTQWVDFAEIRSKVTLEQVLFHYYGLQNLKRNNDKVVGPCPVHNGDSPRAFHADLDRNVWHCFSQCKGGGNQLDLVARKEGISIREAGLKLQEAYLDTARSENSPAPHSDSVQRRTPEPEQEPESEPHATERPGGNPPLSVTLNLKADHPHLLKERGLELPTIEHFGVGYCSRGIMRGTVAFPVHNDSGKLVAYAGRRLKPSDIEQYGKYKFPKGFRKELVLYNLHRVLSQTTTYVILVEGFFSVLLLHQAGYPAVVASMGCELSQYQADQLTQFDQVIVLYDGNDAGWSGAKRVRDMLATRTTVRLAMLPSELEPEDLKPRTLSWLVKGMTALDLAELKFAYSSEPQTDES